jgi:uncharacterized protein YidB (DUF937 family)
MASASLGRLALAALGIIAYQNRDKIAQMLKGPTRDRRDQAQDGGIADVVGGLGEIIDRFRNAGNGSAADSWVSTGPNEAIEPAQVEKALDPETLEALTNQTGLSREEILQRLAINLPEAVDAATPDGTLPQPATTRGEPTLLDPVRKNPLFSEPRGALTNPQMAGTAQTDDERYRSPVATEDRPVLGKPV